MSSLWGSISDEERSVSICKTVLQNDLTIWLFFHPFKKLWWAVRYLFYPHIKWSASPIMSCQACHSESLGSSVDMTDSRKCLGVQTCFRSAWKPFPKDSEKLYFSGPEKKEQKLGEFELECHCYFLLVYPQAGMFWGSRKMWPRF